MNDDGTTKHCLCNGMSRSMCLFIRRVIKQMVLIGEAYHCYHKHTNFVEYSFVKFNCMCIICKQNYWGVGSVGLQHNRSTVECSVYSALVKS